MWGCSPSSTIPDLRPAYLFLSGNDPVPIDLQAEKLPGNKITDLPVAIIASNRPVYLYRMLRKLLTVPGADAKMMTVYIDGFFNEPAAVCKLLNVRAVQHTPICSKNCRIGQVRLKLSLSFLIMKILNHESCYAV